MGVRRPRIESGGSSGGGATPYDRSGQYSDRFSETLTCTNMEEALDEIFVFSSVDPQTTLSLTPSAVREKGDTLASILLSAAQVTGQNPVGTLTELLFKRGSSTIHTIVNPSANETYNETNAVTDTTTFSLQVTDSESRTDTHSRTITFLYPLIYLVGAAGLTAAQIYSGATKILSASENRTISFTTANQVSYYAIPQSEGTFSSILDQNGFETISSWTRRDENIIGLDGSSHAYYIYEFQNLTTTTMEYTFS